MFEDDPAVQLWLSGLAESTKANRLPLIQRFFKFVGVKPSVAVEWQRKNPMSYKFVDGLYDWVDKDGNLGANTKKDRVSIGRGFFLASRVPLPKDTRNRRFHSDKVPVLTELSVDDFRKILLSSNVMYRAAMLTQFQSGSGVGELLFINEFHADFVWDEVRKGKRTIKLDMPGRKSARNVRSYYTFIGVDAVEALKRHFASLGWQKDDVLFKNEMGEPLKQGSYSTYFRNQAIKAGVVQAKSWPCSKCSGETVKRQLKYGDGRRTFYVCVVCGHKNRPEDVGLSAQNWGGIRYKVRTHEMRDTFRTQCHYAQRYNGLDGDCPEFWMGHDIDPLKYDKIMKDVKSTLLEYRKALPYLNILTEEPLKVSRNEVGLEFEGLKETNVMLQKRLAVLESERKVDRERLVRIMEVLKEKGYTE